MVSNKEFRRIMSIESERLEKHYNQVIDQLKKEIEVHIQERNALDNIIKNLHKQLETSNIIWKAYEEKYIELSKAFRTCSNNTEIADATRRFLYPIQAPSKGVDGQQS